MSISHLKYIIPFTCKLLISLFVVWFWFWFFKIDPVRLFESIKDFDPLILVLSFSAILLTFFVNSIRWKSIMRVFGVKSKISTFDLFNATLMGNFVGAFIPVFIGVDLAHSYFSRVHGNSRLSSVICVAVARLFGMLALCALGGFSLLFVQMGTFSKSLRIVSFCLSLFLMLLPFLIIQVRALRFKLYRFFPLYQRAFFCMTKFRVYVTLVSLSLVSQFIFGLSFYFLVLDVDALASLLSVFSVFMFTQFFNLIPSFLNVGPVQSVQAEGMNFLGLLREDAMAIALCHWGLYQLTNLLGGGIIVRETLRKRSKNSPKG